MRKFLNVFFVALIATLFANTAYSQENKLVTIDKLSLEARADFDYFDNDYDGRLSGIDGKYLNFEIKGSFLNDFSYRFRQRLDMYQGSSKTDIMTLTYQPHKNFSFTAGKMALAIGGWEYDLAPIDVYFHSWYWNTFSCYDVGAQVAFHSDNKNHDIIFQVTNSTFTTQKFNGMYAYNLIWYGRMDFFRTAYSINMIEQAKGQYINYIALGNAFDFGKLDFYIDFMNRGFFNQKDFLLGDFTLIGEVKYAFCDKFTLMAKGGYDRNKHEYFTNKPNEVGIMLPQLQDYDMTVMPGVEYTFAGLGFESYPYKGNQNIRIHGFVALNSLCNPEADFDNLQVTTPEPKLSLQVNLGLTWRINFVK